MSILSDALTQCGFPSREEQIAAVTLLHAAGAFTNDAIPESMLDTVSAARFIDEGILDTACSLEGDAGSYLDKWENASVEPLNHTTMRIDFADISKAKIWLNSRGQQSKATLGLQERHQLRVSSQLEVHYEACLPFLKTLQLGPEKPIAIQPHGFAVVFGGGPSGMQSRFDALQQYCLTSDTYPEHIFCLGGARDLWPPTGRDDINGEPAMIPLFIAAIKRAADKRGDLDVPTEAFLELQFETIFAESDPLKPGPQRKACIEWAQATYPGVTWPTEADIMNNLAMNHPFFQTIAQTKSMQITEIFTLIEAPKHMDAKGVWQRPNTRTTLQKLWDDHSEVLSGQPVACISDGTNWRYQEAIARSVMGQHCHICSGGPDFSASDHNTRFANDLNGLFSGIYGWHGLTLEQCTSYEPTEPEPNAAAAFTP